jgi:hypothetical protein
MNPAFIIIRRQPYEEPYHLRLVITASNGVFGGTLEYYCNALDLIDMGTKLMAFPASIGDSYSYELGSPRPEDRFAFHFVLRAYTMDSSGHCALHISLNNNRREPDDSSCSFSIRTEASAINRLGHLLKTFGKLKHRTLRWSEKSGDLLISDSEPGADPLDWISS